jgi:4-hydroxybenzoate polyprenyltransferase
MSLLKTTRQMLEMIRFSHTVFALPFALLAALMAWSAPATDGARVGFQWRHLLGILACMIFARSAAMAFNRVVDRNIDAENPRTAKRHLPSGQLSVAGVWMFTLICCVGFVASTLIFLPNWLPIALAIPVLLFLFGYSYAKRFTSLAHFWLGLSLMLAPVSAWIAIRGEILLQTPADIGPAIALGLVVFTWVSGFDIIYACQDYQFDCESKLHSVPTRLGVPGALRLAAACHLASVLLMAALPALFPALGMGWIFWAGVLAVAVLLMYEHGIVKADDLTRVNVAFFQVNAIISLGLLLIGAIDLWW